MRIQLYSQPMIYRRRMCAASQPNMPALASSSEIARYIELNASGALRIELIRGEAEIGIDRSVMIIHDALCNALFASLAGYQLYQGKAMPRGKLLDNETIRRYATNCLGENKEAALILQLVEGKDLAKILETYLRFLEEDLAIIAKMPSGDLYVPEGFMEKKKSWPGVEKPGLGAHQN